MTAIRTPKAVEDRERITVEGKFGRYTALGFRSASIAAREGRFYSGGSGDAHSQYDRPRLINQSRDFYRNNGLYKGMIDRAISYILANGFSVQVMTDNASFNQKVEGRWANEQKRPEIRGLLSGPETAEMYLKDAVIAGDTGAIKTNKGLIQLVEAEQIDGGHQGRDGIEKNIFGAPVAFWISRYNENGYLTTTGARRIEPKDFLFMTCPDRPSSTRGVPACQSSFPMLHRINDACDSEAIGMQLLSRLVAKITRESAETLAFSESKEDPNKAGADVTGQFGSRLIELEYALIFHGKPGEEIGGIDHNIPGKNFVESVRMFLRLLGLPLGLPLELILLDWTNSNYSQSRAVLEQAYQTFLKWQAKMESFYYGPLIEWKFNAWRTEGFFGNRRDIPYSLIKPTYPWIDQLKEMQAKGMMIDRAVMTHAEACKSRGQDREEVVELREKEIRDAIDRADRIKKDTGTEVDWRLFAGLSSAKAEDAKKAKRPADGSDIDEQTDDQESDDE